MQAVLLAAGIIGGAVVFALAGLVAFRPREPEERLHEVAGFLIAVVGAVYAVVLGFVTVSVWEELGEAAVIVSQEAGESLAVYHTAGALPGPAPRALQARLLDYLDAARAEWQAMEHGRGSPRAHAAMRRVLHLGAQIEPRTPRDEVLYQNLVHGVHEVGRARERRLLAARERVHPAVWFVLIGGGAITIAFTWFFRLGTFRAQAVMTGGLATLIALNLFLIAATDQPFGGGVRVEPTALERALAEARGDGSDG